LKIKFRDIEDAYMMANTGGYGESTSLLDKASGIFYYESDNTDEKIPEEIFASDDVVSLPDKNELDLGSRLVFRFIRATFPEGYDKVSEIFTRRGAYGRYKKWLIANNLLDKWYDYSNAAENAALREWCADNGIELED
jgi:hypothetical protein